LMTGLQDLSMRYFSTGLMAASGEGPAITEKTTASAGSFRKLNVIPPPIRTF
jgi:hypothetical protein